MKRREFVRGAAVASAAGLTGRSLADADRPADSQDGQSFAVDDTQVTFHTNAVTRPVNVLVVADTHLFTDDHRGIPYREFSGRMAKAYNKTAHFQNGAPTNPEQSFEEALNRAASEDVDLLALVGDIFSFPSEAAVEWVTERLAKVTMPWVYVAGNHDWHYEGMPGPLEDLRDEWIEKRLTPMYQGNDPLMSVRDVHGIRFLTIDNSNYEIQPKQLEFFRSQVAGGRPLVLLVHIPLYAPGRPMGFGCGHPHWGASTDRNYEIERRPKWRDSGHTQTTMDFHREVFEASNLMGIFAGHIHRQSIDVINGIPQFVTNANAYGAYTDVLFVPTA